MNLLNKLRVATHHFVDGTYKITPPYFSQVVNWGVWDAEHFEYRVVAHILVTGQTQHIYNQITHLLTASAGLSKLQPLSITTDFEMALMNNFRDHYPTVPINGCLFHAKQAWHKRLKKLRIDGNHFGYLIREHGLIDFLAVIPKNLVKVKGIPYIKTDLDRRFGSEINRTLWDQFWKYCIPPAENDPR